MLFLHGGPGNSVIHYAEKFTHKLQEHFIVVQWDQRNAGKTLTLNKSPEPLTIDLFESDTHQIIDSLLKRFHQPKLYLVGHSWGTFLGFYMAKNYPELLYAYIPICPMINQQESERITLASMKEKASKAGNEEALRELSLVKIPFENGETAVFSSQVGFGLYGVQSKDYEDTSTRMGADVVGVYLMRRQRIIYLKVRGRFVARSIFLWVERMSRRTQALRRNIIIFSMPQKSNYIGSSAQAIRCPPLNQLVAGDYYWYKGEVKYDSPQRHKAHRVSQRVLY